jgi:hypothetical protein
MVVAVEVTSTWSDEFLSWVMLRGFIWIAASKINASLPGALGGDLSE